MKKPKQPKRSYNITNKRLAMRKYMSYSALQNSVRDFGIKNKYQYEKWVRNDKPLAVPMYPWRVYEEWTTWGELLGTDNEFVPFMKWKEMRKKTWRTYWESARWIQQQKYNSAREFTESYNRGEIPADIPKSPHQVYDEKYEGGWQGWKNFLGKNIQSKIQLAQEINNMQKLFAITAISGYPNNYFRIINAPEGENDLSQKVNVTAFRVYEYDEDNQKELGRIISQVASSQGGDTYLCNNMNNLFFELDSVFIFNKNIGNNILKKIRKNTT